MEHGGVGWYQAKATIGRLKLCVHDLGHTAASTWLGSGADPKVVQRVLGHASAAMTMDLWPPNRPQPLGRCRLVRGPPRTRGGTTNATHLRDVGLSGPNGWRRLSEPNR
jgi:integrase